MVVLGLLECVLYIYDLGRLPFSIQGFGLVNAVNPVKLDPLVAKGKWCHFNPPFSQNHFA